VILQQPRGGVLWQEMEEVKSKVSWPARLQRRCSPWTWNNGGDDLDSGGTVVAFDADGGQ
jgi:hypothetical protein